MTEITIWKLGNLCLNTEDWYATGDVHSGHSDFAIYSLNHLVNILLFVHSSAFLTCVFILSWKPFN